MEPTPDSPATPQVHPSAVVCAGAVLIGQVVIEQDCFVGPNAVLRGDIEPLTMRRGSNVQDCVVLHTHAGNPVVVGEEASVGHGAVVHGATIGPHSIVGMNATVLDKAVVGDHAVVGAGAVVPNGFVVPPRSLAVGIPCRVVKTDDDAVAEMAYQNGQRYLRYREEHIAGRWGVLRGPLGPGAPGDP